MCLGFLISSILKDVSLILCVPFCDTMVFLLAHDETAFIFAVNSMGIKPGVSLMKVMCKVIIMYFILKICSIICVNIVFMSTIVSIVLK